MIGVYDYTVILTYLSLLSGCTGMIIAMSGLGHPYLGMFFMLFSGLCDGFDGRVARTKKDRSSLEKRFGVQIDSFADLISFGVLPAAIGMSMLRASSKFSDLPYRMESGQMRIYPILLFLIALLYILAAMIRLAYFNATEEEREQEAQEKGACYYTGLPVTAAALVFPMVLLLHYIPRFDLSIVYFIVMLVMAVLFVGGFKIKKPGKKGLAIMVAVGLGEFILYLVLTYLTKS
ncbi:MAG: CDP-alcohol phosphatidyltransferase family protein [Oscillospiraceae bacterium]|nr:CDP-alcohol phosphatidyltransferase family protein [Oscillospiraceae bacterium]